MSCLRWDLNPCTCTYLCVHAVHVQYVLYMYCMYYIFFHSLTFQLSFSPRHAGKYKAILNVIHHTGSIISQSPLASITIEASAEKPRLQILTGNEDTMSLDYGVVLPGKNSSLPFYIVNHGQADVPLRLSLSTVSCLKVEINT